MELVLFEFHCVCENRMSGSTSGDDLPETYWESLPETIKPPPSKAKVDKTFLTGSIVIQLNKEDKLLAFHSNFWHRCQTTTVGGKK